MEQLRSGTKTKKSQGFTILTSVLILSVIIGVISVSLLLISTDVAINVGYSSESTQTRIAADSCAEYALNQLRTDLNYIGEEIVELGNSQCSVLGVTGNGNTDRTITVESTYKNSTRGVIIEIATIRPDLEIRNWSEALD